MQKPNKFLELKVSKSREKNWSSQFFQENERNTRKNYPESSKDTVKSQAGARLG